MKPTKLETPEDARIAATSDAFKILSLRAHGVEELREKLLKKHAADTVEAVVASFRSRGLLNDEKFAKFFAESRALSQPTGKKRLEEELRRKGIAKETIAKTISGLEDYDERAEARKLVASRIDRMKGVPGPKKKMRLFGLLKRRGFGNDAVYATLNEFFKDFQEP
jgi:regulatory protein